MPGAKNLPWLRRFLFGSVAFFDRRSRPSSKEGKNTFFFQVCPLELRRYALRKGAQLCVHALNLILGLLKIRRIIDDKIRVPYLLSQRHL